MEVFVDIKGYEGEYQISNLGNVKSLKRNKILSPSPHTKGYLKAQLLHNGKRKMVYIHRLVAEAFIPNPKELSQVNHKDGNRKNNAVENLEWCSCQENIIHSWRNAVEV